MEVKDFKWVKGENDYEYIQLLEAECKRKDVIISRAINKLKADRKTENKSEIPNNCEHITEDGVTCAKYPACDDCLENPLNKVKGSERLVKGSEVTTDCRQLERSRR